VRFSFEGTRALDLTPVGVNGETVWARVTPIDALGAVVCFESNGTFIELPAPDFDRYLALEGLTAPLAARARLGAAAPPGRELYRRACKTWIRGSDAARITRAYGLPLELVPDADPVSSPRVVSACSTRASPCRARSCARFARACGRRGGLGRPSASGRADAQATSCSTCGRRALARQHRPHGAVPDPALADWQSTWASLTFRR
jgi:hypothetical protein